MTILSKNIITIRGNLTQTEFGDIIGANKNKVYTYEKEKQSSIPKPPVLQAIADYAGISIDDLHNKELKIYDLSIQTDFKSNKRNTTSVQEQIIAINAQLKVLFLKVVEIESTDLNSRKVRKSPTEVNLELANLIARETKRMMDELQSV